MSRLAPNQLKEKSLNRLKEGMHSDGGNLYLSIRGNSRAWVFRFKSPTTGKIRMLGLGSLPDVTLDHAREIARQSREMLRNDLDPLQQKQAGKLAVRENRKTFEMVAKEYIEDRSKRWRGKSTKAEIEALFVNYLYPAFKDRPIQSISPDDVRILLKKIWYEKTITGSKLQGLLDRVFKYAQTRGWFYGDNPAKWTGFLETILPKPSDFKKVEHRKAYDWQQINTLYKRLKSINDIPNLAACFICLTACRSAEGREMRVDEIDFKDKVWTLPEERSKTNNEHRVPLSDEALDVIKRAMAINNNQGQYVLQNSNGKPIYNKAVLQAVKDAANDPEMTLHGFRSSFRDWGSEATNTQSEILEMALGHAIKSKVESAYRRGDLLDKRRSLMNQWAKFVKA
ncbi:Integrase/recombinase [Commensalibacter communis]|uniref:tyrosine-type recombinase/integrase n=1 Tax=Commensalibacter communis TaxID=2972786 RepID=UPI0022FFA724|nr:site-specific integrase [Commensalibacter communis]CAI3959615.1 Integrase/recombinase [Commensalibacter communis]